MTLRKTFCLPIALVLSTCSSCQLSQLSQIDRNGDGEISSDEVLATAVDFVCGTQMSSNTTDDPATSDVSGNTDTTADGAATIDAAN